MGFGIFKKDKKKKDEKNDETPKEFGNVGTQQEKSSAVIPKALPKEFGVLKGFYVSEKSSALNAFNQYVFKIFNKVTKNEVKKQVENSFGVKVKGVKIINLPRKKRNVGRHKGFKSGLKKAVVGLEKGHSIEGFQP